MKGLRGAILFILLLIITGVLFTQDQRRLNVLFMISDDLTTTALSSNEDSALLSLQGNKATIYKTKTRFEGHIFRQHLQKHLSLATCPNKLIIYDALSEGLIKALKQRIA